MEQLYKKIMIKGESDLPKEKGKYWSGINEKPLEMGLREFDPDDPDDIFVMKYVDWYLIPFTPDSKAVIMPTEEQISDYASLQVSRYLKAKNDPTVDLHRRFRDMAKWYRSQLKTVNLKDELVKFCEKTHGYQLTPYQKIVDDYLSGKGKEGEK